MNGVPNSTACGTIGVAAPPMFNQTFASNDLFQIGVLVVLEALLSADNALVLAILVRHLAKEDQKKALMYGLLGAFVLRAGAIILATYIIAFWWLQLIGALYLIYLPVKHFVKAASGGGHQDGKQMGFWATVVYLNLVDLAFALDSVIVAVAVVDTVKHPDKVWVVIAGAIIGIVLLRFAANYFLRLLERFPALDHVAYLLVGWAGVKLFFISGHSFDRWYTSSGRGELPFHVPEMPTWLFWVGMAIIATFGTLYAVRSAKPELVEVEEVPEVVAVFDEDQSSTLAENLGKTP